MASKLIANEAVEAVVKDEPKEEIDEDIKKRIQKNKEKALLLRKAKVVAHPYAKKNDGDGTQGKIIKVSEQKVIDTGAGFLIEEDDDIEKAMINIAAEPAPIVSKLPICDECKKEFKDSFLLQKFDYLVCDNCRDDSGKHSLIAKTQAKAEYLLKDCDIDKRDPPLKFILRKNPHKAHSDMKLYLQIQIEERALMVWGSEDALRDELERRDIKRQESKIKNFNKKMNKLRMEMRSSLYDKTKKASHTHVFGPDKCIDEEEDLYSHTCKECGYVEEFEKM